MKDYYLNKRFFKIFFKDLKTGKEYENIYKFKDNKTLNEKTIKEKIKADIINDKGEITKDIIKIIEIDLNEYLKNKKNIQLFFKAVFYSKIKHDFKILCCNALNMEKATFYFNGKTNHNFILCDIIEINQAEYIEILEANQIKSA